RSRANNELDAFTGAEIRNEGCRTGQKTDRSLPKCRVAVRRRQIGLGGLTVSDRVVVPESLLLFFFFFVLVLVVVVQVFVVPTVVVQVVVIEVVVAFVVVQVVVVIEVVEVVLLVVFFVVVLILLLVLFVDLSGLVVVARPRRGEFVGDGPRGDHRGVDD